MIWSWGCAILCWCDGGLGHGTDWTWSEVIISKLNLRVLWRSTTSGTVRACPSKGARSLFWISLDWFSGTIIPPHRGGTESTGKCIEEDSNKDLSSALGFFWRTSSYSDFMGVELDSFCNRRNETKRNETQFCKTGFWLIFMLRLNPCLQLTPVKFLVGYPAKHVKLWTAP